jgi:signal transduction histidine kinase
MPISKTFGKSLNSSQISLLLPSTGLGISLSMGTAGMLKIWSKLFVAFILITLITMSTAGWILNNSFQDKFAEYVKNNLNEKHGNVMSYVETQLQNKVSPHDFLLNLAHFSVMENVHVELVLPSGETVFNSRNAESMMAPFRPKVHQSTGKPYITQKRIHTDETEMIVRVSSELGHGIWSPQDITFREAIYYSLLVSVGVALFLAVFFSVAFSSMITSPVARLKNAALRLSRGDWKTRVQIKTGDELEELGESFNKMAHDLEHLEHLRRKMTSDLAHELRNPLMSIQIYIEGMLDEVIEPDETHLNELLEEVQRLSRLIEDMNKLAQVEARRQLTVDRFHLQKEFTPYLQRMQRSYAQKEIEFVWDVADVEGNLDKFLVKEVLQNLLDNALKYSRPGGKVDCRIRRVKLENQPALEIRVADTGIGIGETDLPYIFERFYRADPSRSRQTGGTGIGLAISKELVELMEGTITVESSLGVGAVFVVCIPFAK